MCHQTRNPPGQHTQRTRLLRSRRVSATVSASLFATASRRASATGCSSASASPSHRNTSLQVRTACTRPRGLQRRSSGRRHCSRWVTSSARTHLHRRTASTLLRDWRWPAASSLRRTTSTYCPRQSCQRQARTRPSRSRRSLPRSRTRPLSPSPSATVTHRASASRCLSSWASPSHRSTSPQARTACTRPRGRRRRSSGRRHCSRRTTNWARTRQHLDTVSMSRRPRHWPATGTPSHRSSMCCLHRSCQPHTTRSRCYNLRSSRHCKTSPESVSVMES